MLCIWLPQQRYRQNNSVKFHRFASIDFFTSMLCYSLILQGVMLFFSPFHMEHHSIFAQSKDNILIFSYFFLDPLYHNMRNFWIKAVCRDKWNHLNIKCCILILSEIKTTASHETGRLKAGADPNIFNAFPSYMNFS